MKLLYKLFLILPALFIYSISAQTVTGSLVDQNGKGLAELNLQLFVNPKVYSAISASDGSFVFTNITEVKKDQLPTGYSVSVNYPNPFNPRTRIVFTMPKSGNVKAEIFNLLGQKVREDVVRNFTAGNSYLDLELNGLPNGFYIAYITIDNKYTFTRKLMLLYGSRHLAVSNRTFESGLNKTGSALDTKFDSLVVTGSTIKRQVFTKLPIMQGSSLDLGKITVFVNASLPCPGIPTVKYMGITYNTVQIGGQCWLRENIAVGTMIQGTQDQTNNNIIEKYCYNNDTANCAKYGGLYMWAEALQYANGASNTGFLQPPIAEKYIQGICPDDWHIPMKSEYDSLQTFVNNSRDALLAENQLTGNNTSGFSALLSGTRLSADSSFNLLGLYSYFWSNTESTNPVNALFMSLNDSRGTVLINYNNKKIGMSVRCIKDPEKAPEPPTLLLPLNGSTHSCVDLQLSWNPSFNAQSYIIEVAADSQFTKLVFSKSNLTATTQGITGLDFTTKYYWRVAAANKYGVSNWSSIWNATTWQKPEPCPEAPSITYAGKVYNTIKIGNQCWLKENLNIGQVLLSSQSQTDNKIIEKFCLFDDTANCTKYGGLYQWNEMMQYNTTEKTQGICPAGWHIPSLSEFQELGNSVMSVGGKLISEDEGGTNESKFSALFAGLWESTYHMFTHYNSTTFWTSKNPYKFIIDKSLVNSNTQVPGSGFSVRCLKDN